MSAKKTVLITGSSTGIGRASVLLFLEKGWNVSATMRSPEKSTLPIHENLLVTKLDVTDSQSIDLALQETYKKFGSLDVIVNNAGYGLTGPFEGTSEEQIKKQFDTNVFGLMNVCRKALSFWREKKTKATLINISSMVGRFSVPFFSLYNTTKWAVDGFSESLQYEARAIGVRVKIVGPGSIKTDFKNAMETSDNSAPNEYQSSLKSLRNKLQVSDHTAADPLCVAKVIYRAASTSSNKLRYTAGVDAKILTFLKRFLPENIFYFLIRTAMLR